MKASQSRSKRISSILIIDNVQLPDMSYPIKGKYPLLLIPELPFGSVEKNSCQLVLLEENNNAIDLSYLMVEFGKKYL